MLPTARSTAQTITAHGRVCSHVFETRAHLHLRKTKSVAKLLSEVFIIVFLYFPC